MKIIMSFVFTLILVLAAPIMSDASVIHIVKKGENLGEIAKTYNVTINKLSELNGLTNKEMIIPGQPLLVPGQTYFVQPGDTLWEISDRHSVKLNHLKQLNKLNTSTIYPKQAITIPKSPKEKIFTGSFLVPKNEESDRWLLEKYKGFINSVGFFEYHPDSQGNLSKMWGEQSIKTAWNNNITPYATVTNLSSEGFDHGLAHQVISDPKIRHKLINNIYKVIHKNDLKGVIIDFEGVMPKDRNNFNTFIKELKERLHPVNMKVAVALPPMLGNKYPEYHAAYDYQTIGKNVDFMFLMTYDWHWFGGPSGPISPINKIRETIEYAISVIPKSKIILGVPMYAYDWITNNQDQKGSAYSQEQAIDVALKHQTVIYYNDKAEQPWFNYYDKEGNKHEVWFEDARSILEKYRLVKEYNLAGMGGWKLGLSFPQAEQLLKEEFIISNDGMK